MKCRSTKTSRVLMNTGAHAALAFSVAVLGAHAEVHLASVLTDHMVVQRNQPVHVWGVADPNEEGVVTFRDHTATFKADSLGRWSVYLAQGDAGGPFKLAVQATNRVELTDVLVGDLWLASGQSNMGFPMSNSTLLHGAEEIASANHPTIRLLSVRRKVSSYPLEDADVGGWQPCSSDSVREFSAVAYLFGRELSEAEKVPIGLIDSSWGGTPAEAWTSLDALSTDPALMPVFAARAQMMDALSAVRRKQAMEQRALDQRKLAGNGQLTLPWHPDPNSWEPSALYNAMIAPLTPMPIRGVIWYQGESNTDALRAPVYKRLFETLISDWRGQWQQATMPFLFVQLSTFKTADLWPEVREAQRDALELRNTGMAVTIDTNPGNQIHPPDKQDAAHRLALLARQMVYGEAVEDSGPLFLDAVPMGNEMVVYFSHANGLHATTGEVKGFEVAGDDGSFLPAIAMIKDGRVQASSPQVLRPRYVRYGWSSTPDCNLFNGDGLPASPFTSKR